MPIVIDNTSTGVEDEFESVELFGENDEPTLEAEVIVGFLEALDWDDVLDDEDVREFVEMEEKYYKTSKDDDGKVTFESVDDELVEGKEGDEGVELVVVETLEGEIAHLFVDEEDLFEMFKYYVGTLPEETLEEKALKAVFADLLDEESEEVDEAKGPFKKGAFRKIHKGGGGALVNRMLGAMMNKQSIKRAKKPGAGYKKGDYTRAGGYAPGTSSGVKKWKAYKVKKAASLAKEAKKTLASKRKGLKKAGLKAAPKKGAKKTGAKGLAKKKGKSKKGMAASDQTTPPANLNEEKKPEGIPAYPSMHLTGAALAGKIHENLLSPEARAKRAEEKKKDQK